MNVLISSFVFQCPFNTRLFHSQINLIILQIPGMTLLATGVKFLKNPDAIHYLEIICYQGNGWLKHISLLLAISGSVSVFAGIFRVCVIQLKTSQETLLVSRVFNNMFQLQK